MQIRRDSRWLIYLPRWRAHTASENVWRQDRHRQPVVSLVSSRPNLCVASYISS